MLLEGIRIERKADEFDFDARLTSLQSGQGFKTSLAPSENPNPKKNLKKTKIKHIFEHAPLMGHTHMGHGHLGHS